MDHAPQTVSDEQRSKLLDDAVGQYLMAGYELRGRSGFQAAVGTNAQPVNHVLHLLIAVFTCGLWAIVWLLLALGAPKATTVYLSVDEYGRAWSMREGRQWVPLEA
jgi:hypothetical protein